MSTKAKIRATPDEQNPGRWRWGWLVPLGPGGSVAGGASTHAEALSWVCFYLRRQADR